VATVLNVDRGDSMILILHVPPLGGGERVETFLEKSWEVLEQ